MVSMVTDMWSLVLLSPVLPESLGRYIDRRLLLYHVGTSAQYSVTNERKILNVVLGFDFGVRCCLNRPAVRYFENSVSAKWG